MEGGVNLEQAAALVAAANRVIQDPNSVGSALRTISLRLRGTSVEVLEAMGEETDNVVESTSKLQAKLKALTGVDILTDAGTYKDVYTILREIGNVWQDIDPMDQAAALELMAGKNRANTLSAILNNMQDLEGAYESALNAEGSALKENEAYLDSIQGKIDLFNNSVQTMWMNFMNSEVVKWLVDVGKLLVEITDNVGLFTTAMSTVGAFFVNKNFGKTLFGDPKDIKASIEGLNELKEAESVARAAWESDKGNDKKFQKYETAKRKVEAYKEELDRAKDSNINMSAAAEDAGNQAQIAGDKADIAGKKSSGSFAKATQSVKQFAQSMLMMVAISAAVETLWNIGEMAADWFKSMDKSFETLNDQFQEQNDQLSNCKSEIKSLESELDTTNDKIEELMSQGTLTFAEQEELERLQEISAELEKQIGLKEQLQGSLQKGLNDKAINTAEAYLNTSFDSEKSKTERQEEAEENGKKMGKGLGLVAGGLIAAAIAGVFTGGVGFAAALPTILAGAGAGSIGGDLLGGLFGSIKEGAAYDQEQTVGDAIENMKEERARLENAANDAYKAYVADPTGEGLADTYNSAAQALSLYDEKMAEHINTLSQYYNAVDWKSADIKQQEDAREIGDMLDKYAIAMGGVNSKQNAIQRIFGTEADADLQRVKSALDDMAEAGEKIDLKKSFGSNTEAYDAFVDRLYEMGIYVYECEDAFKKLKEAEEAAAEVDFSGIVSGVSKIASAISGVQDAFDEFLKDGSLSIDTVLSLQEHFDTDGLKAEYEKYLEVMMSGNSSIEDAKNATEELAQAYLQEKVSLGPLTEEQKRLYTSLFKKMGITNADEFIKKELQQSGIEAATNEFNKALTEAKNFVGPLSPEFSSVEDFASSKLDMDAINDIINKYELEADVVDQLIVKLKEKNKLEADRDVAKDAQKKYQDHIDAYNAAKQDVEQYSSVVKNYNPNADWVYQSTGKNHGKYGAMYMDASGNSVTSYLTEDELNKLEQDYANYINDLEEYNKLLSEGITNQWLNADGTIKEGVEEGFATALSEAEAAVKAAEAEIDAEFTIDFDLEFAENLKDNTISGLTEAVAEYKAVLSETSEVVADGQVVSEEYKNSLVELGISHAQLNEYFDDSNPLLVKNAKGLNNLVKAAKKATAQNIKLAKSNARLDYYELYKEMQKCFDQNGNMLKGKYNTIMALYEEMGALQKTISKYAILEAELMGATSAYEKFVEAQEYDSSTDYISNIEEMVLALGEAFSTGKLGTETAQAAIRGLIPEDVYKDIEALDTVEEQMAAIYKYFREGKIAQYFTLEFDDNGAITSAEMKLGNLRKFIEDGLSDLNKDGILNDVFSGESWQKFEFSKEFLSQLDALPESADKLQFFADKMGVTKDVAFAFLKTLEDYDIEWLGGDYSSLLERIIPETFEGKIYDAISALSELEAKFARGDIGAEEYASQYNTLKNNIAALGNEARNQVNEYNHLMSDIESQKKIIDDAYKIINDPKNHTEQEIKIAYGDVQAASKELTRLYGDLKTIEEPKELTIKYALDAVTADVNILQSEIQSAFGGKVVLNKDGELELNASINITVDSLSEEEKEKWIEYQSLLNEKHSMEINADPEDAKTALETIEDAAGTALEVIKKIDGTTITINTSSAVSNVHKLTDALKELAGIEYVSVNTEEPVNKHAGGKWKHNIMPVAYANGSDSVPKTEEALVGELGPEILVRNGRWTTVGENGAEFTQVKKGDIIFNHRQSEQLLKNGHIASRGKAFAGGTAYNTIFSNATSKDQWTGTGYSSATDPTYDLQEALSGAADSVGEFEETIDWIEIRMEELGEQLSLYGARLENALTGDAKNAIIDTMIGINKTIQDNAEAGAKYYENKAEQYLTGLSKELVLAAKNGAISISEFTKENDEATVKAIQNYRDFAQKAAELYQQVEETTTEIRNLAIQQLDNAQHSGTVKADIEDKQTEKLQNAVDFDEARGIITNPDYYVAMMENSSKSVEYLTAARKKMQKEFDDMLKDGLFTEDDGSFNDKFYEELSKLYDIDAEIDNATKELEEFQNAINDIYWKNFDQLVNRFEYISEEAQGLIDLMSDLDMVSKPDNEDGWSKDDVEWTKGGLATLGLHAQEMERAEEKAKMYAKAIDDLTTEYEAGHYSESEFYEKLNELTKGQYDAIKAAQDEKKAIVDLNEQRIDAVKEGIEKQIEAYKKLIEIEKEELETKKDTYDFNKSTMDQQKSIIEIQRKIASVSAAATQGDLASIAKKKQLEAELLKAQEELQESYHDRSVSNQQDALDKELENFQTAQEKKIEDLDKLLEDVETIVAESLVIVKANAEEIGATLTEKTSEYNLTVSDAILNPWKDGSVAIDEYTTKFGDSVSSTIEQLETIRSKWQEVKGAIADANKEADNYYNKDAATSSGPSVPDIHAENAEYYAAKPTEAPSTTPAPNPDKAEPQYSTYTVKSGDSLSTIAKNKLGSVSRWKEIYDLNKDIVKNPNLIYPGQQLKIPKYAKGTLGAAKDQWALIDELGEELILRPQNGRLTYLEKGSGVVPADLTSNLMEWGKLDPSIMLDQNRPSVGVHPEVHNTQIQIDNSIAELIHIDHCDQSTLPDVEKIVNNALEKHTQKLNQSLRKFTR